MKWVRAPHLGRLYSECGKYFIQYASDDDGDRYIEAWRIDEKKRRERIACAEAANNETSNVRIRHALKRICVIDKAHGGLVGEGNCFACSDADLWQIKRLSESEGASNG